MTIFVDDGINQIATVVRRALFVIYVIIINIDGKARVICDIVFSYRRGICENITVSICEKIKLSDFLTRFQRENRT